MTQNTPDETPRLQRIDAVERAVIFRISRGMLLAFGALSTLALVLALGGFAWSLTPVLKGSGPADPPPLKPAEVTAAEVAALLDQGTAPPPAWEPPPEYEGEGEVEANPYQDELNGLVAQLLQEYGGNVEAFPWKPEFKSGCIQKNFYGYCIQMGRKLTRKGAEDLLKFAFDGMAPSDQVIFLRAYLEVVKLMPMDDDVRLVALRSFTDVKMAYRKNVPDTFAALVGTLKPVDTKGGAREPLSDSARAALMRGLLVARKRDGTPEQLTQFVELVRPALRLAPEGDPGGEFVAVFWPGVRELPRDAAERAIQGAVGALEGISSERRVLAAQVYFRLLREKNAAGLREFMDAQAKVQAERARIEAEHDRKVAQDAELRGVAVTGIGSALLSLMLLGLLLAVLAVERHARVLEQALLQQRQQRGEPSDVAPAPSQDRAPSSAA